MGGSISPIASDCLLYLGVWESADSSLMNANLHLQDWPFHAGWEVDLQTEPRSELVSIPEEGTSNSAKASNAAACLLFLLGLDIDGCSFIDNLPIGALHVTLLFVPVSESSAPEAPPRLGQTLCVHLESCRRPNQVSVSILYDSLTLQEQG